MNKSNVIQKKYVMILFLLFLLFFILPFELMVIKILENVNFIISVF